MYNNINIDINNSNVYLSNNEDNTLQKLVQQGTVENNINLPQKTSEDELVEFSEFNSEILEKQEEITVLIQEYTNEMNEYFRKQTELIELQRQYDEIQRQLANSDDDDEKRKLQGKLSEFETEISALQNNMKASNETLNSINALLHAAMCDVATQSTVQPVQNTAQAAQASIQTYAQNTPLTVQNQNSVNVTTQNVQYTGNTIPKGLAARLDNRLGQGFSQKCEQVASKLGCNTNDLLAMMYSESGLKTTARNKSSNAVGLIQFIPSTLSSNGYSTEQVASMSAVEQLDVVADIFMKAKKMAGYGANEKIDGGTLYAINWLPAYAKRSTIVSKGEKYYSQGLDMNKDGSVTKNDLSQRLQSKYNEMLRAI